MLVAWRCFMLSVGVLWLSQLRPLQASCSRMVTLMARRRLRSSVPAGEQSEGQQVVGFPAPMLCLSRNTPLLDCPLRRRKLWEISCFMF